MEKDFAGFFFIDPRTCEEVLYVPRVFEVRYFQRKNSKKPTYRVDFSVNRLERYAVADSLHSEGVMWGVKNGFAEKIEIGGNSLKKICSLCRKADKGDLEARNLAERTAIELFNLTSFLLSEISDELDDEDDEDDEDFDFPADGT